MSTYRYATASLWLGLCLSLGLFPAAGWEGPLPPAKPVATAAAGKEPLPVADPVDFLHQCLERYDRQQIQGDRLVMQKQERIRRKRGPLEVIEVWFRAKPYSVFMHWLAGARQAASVLYVAGENNGQMLVHPTGLAGTLVKVVTRDPEGPEARREGRYSIKEFGLRATQERTWNDWKAAKEQGTLRVEYLGVEKVKPAGDRACYALRRTQEPDADGVTEVIVYIDRETRFQVGTVLRGDRGELIGEYMYRDIHLNPEFKPGQFTAAALEP